MASIVYLLCGLASLACSVLLIRQYRFTRGRLVLWSACCFVCFAISNIILFLDLVVLPEIDLSAIRNALTLVGMMLLLYGMIRETT